MSLYKVYIDNNRKIVALPAWANPDNRANGDSGQGFVVIDLTDDQVKKAIPNHSILSADNKIIIDDDYVPPVDPSSDPHPDPTSAAVAALSATVAKQGIMIANLTLQIAKMKVGK